MSHRWVASAICVAIFLFFFGLTDGTPLLGQKECTWGPSYWCSNITNAKGCGAVKHCIKTVWEKQIVPEDTDEVCKICTDMVKQARDQLESNQTQEDLKAVFEGSCNLIPIKIIDRECIKLVDDFIPELVETLASQMNPQVVCSVAGLCNNARIDALLAERKNSDVDSVDELCDGCNIVVGKMRSNFDALPYEGFLEKLLRACGKLGSFSDSCATLVFSHFEDYYSHLKANFYPENVCHVMGTCSKKFHRHETDSSANVEITPMGRVGRLDIGDDVPCELCEKLVLHARDIIIANTTEDEFKRVLDGICKQTGSFASECLSISDQYYPIIYDFLVKELDPKEVCFMIGICHKNAKQELGLVAPLVPIHTVEIAVKVLQKHEKLIGGDEKNINKPQPSQESVKFIKPELSQLPIDRMMIQLPQSNEVCVFCQYFLHYVQEQISDDKTEEKIKEAVEKACNVLPNSVESQCQTFIEAYGSAVIAMLAQEIDPSIICPELTLCPKKEAKIEVLMTTGSNSAPNCPLCLFAVEQLESMLKNNRTEATIQHALDSLCNYLPSKLRPECADFVDTYSKQLVEMLSVEFTPQEVCVYLKICSDSRPDNSMNEEVTLINYFHSNKHLMADRNRFKKPLFMHNIEADLAVDKRAHIETNEIPDNTYNGKTISSFNKVKSSPGCVLCEFIMTQIDKELTDKRTDDEIKHLVHNICNHMPKSVKDNCNNFVNKYADAIIDLLSKELSPKEVCSTMALCIGQSDALKASVTECAVCHELIDMLDHILSNPNVDRSIEHLIEKTCRVLPSHYVDTCKTIMETYGQTLIHLVANLADSSKICPELNMCGTNGGSFVKLSKRQLQEPLGKKKCTWGPSYWCDSEDNANECQALNHCREHVWKADKPTKE